MRRHAAELILLLALACLAACKGDDYYYPDLLTDMVEVDTDNLGVFRVMRTDDKKEYQIGTKLTFSESRPDTTYRARCSYLVEDSLKVKPYRLWLLVSPHPQSASYFKDGVKTDPVKLTSIWQSGGYINLHAGLMTKGESAHKFHFVKSELKKTVAGKRRVDIQLYHSRNDDPEAYTENVFLSCPLSSLGLEAGDSIYFSVCTYDGVKTHGFVR